jgi:uncharacterized protein YqeY
MPTLKDRIQDDMKNAMRAKEKARLSTIRLILAAIKQKEVDERISLDDSQILAVLDKMVKQRRDSIKQYEEAGRQELADKEKEEIAVLQEYLPKQADEAEIEAIIAETIAATGATSPKDMGKVMGAIKPRLQGRADMGQVSQLIKARLSAL